MKFAASLVAVALLQASVWAGIVMKGTQQNNSAKSSENMDIFINPKAVKINLDSKKGKQTIIYRDDLFKFWIINSAKSTYIEFGKSDFDSMKKKLKELEAMMKGLPPEQKAMMKQMMGSNVPDFDASPSELKATGKKQSVGKWKCEEFNEVRDGKVESKVCMTPVKNVGISNNDLKAITNLAAKVEEIQLQNKQTESAKYFAKDILNKNGFPVMIKSMNGAKVSSVMKWESIEKKNLDDSLFSLPKGLKREKSAFQ